MGAKLNSQLRRTRCCGLLYFIVVFVKSTLLRWLLDRNISDAIVRSFVIVVSSERSLQNL